MDMAKIQKATLADVQSVITEILQALNTINSGAMYTRKVSNLVIGNKNIEYGVYAKEIPLPAAAPVAPAAAPAVESAVLEAAEELSE